MTEQKAMNQQRRHKYSGGRRQCLPRKVRGKQEYDIIEVEEEIVSKKKMGCSPYVNLLS
jgi:hypothetical protein